MKVCCYRLDPDEKTRLDKLAAKHHVTLSHALREGARLYLRDLDDAAKQATGVVRT